MAKQFNFNTLKKRYMTVVLPDEKKTVLLVGMPTKNIFDEFIKIQDAGRESETAVEALELLYSMCAKVLNNNKGGIKITTEYIEDNFDMDDIMALIEAYSEFIGEVNNVKN